jgi:hypothetical protein
MNLLPRKAPERSKKLRRNGSKAGLFPDAIERANDRVAGKAAAECTDFVVDPDEKVVTPPPSQGSAGS